MVRTEFGPLAAPSANTGSTNPGGANQSGIGNLYGSPGAALGTAGSLFGIASGIQSGTPTGYASAGLGAAGLANKAGAFGATNPQLGAGLGIAGGALGIYSGLQQGGVQGYTQAGVGATGAAAGGASLAGDSSLAGTLGTAAGVAGTGLSLYNEINTYESGKSGQDALSGAETGASAGQL